jgi:hypothetical protein
VLEELPSVGVRCEERLDFVPQTGIGAGGVLYERFAVAFSLVQRRYENLRRLLPTVRIHESDSRSS